jgi:hypothetical protein
MTGDDDQDLAIVAARVRERGNRRKNRGGSDPTRRSSDGRKILRYLRGRRDAPTEFVRAMPRKPERNSRCVMSKAGRSIG